MLNYFLRLFRRKVYRESVMNTSLKRYLGIFHLIFYGLSAMMGAGLYVITGTMLREVAGPSTTISFAIGALVIVCTALCYAEFATVVPRAGSIYTYTYITMGELPAFIVGWSLLGDYITGVASVAKGFSGTLNAVTGNKIQQWIESHMATFGDDNPILAPYPDLVGAALILVMMIINMIGVMATAWYNTVCCIIQILILGVIISSAFVYGDMGNWTSADGFFPFGYTGMMSATAISLYAYSGFDCIANASEETNQPRKTIPAAILISIGIAAVLLCVSALALSYLTSYTQIDLSSPYVEAFRDLHVIWAEYLSAVGTLVATGLTKITLLYVIPRMVYAMANDGVIFRCLAYVSYFTQVPVIALFIFGTLAAVMALLIRIDVLATMVSMGSLVAYGFIGIDILILRYTQDWSSIFGKELNPDSGVVVTQDTIGFRIQLLSLHLQKRFNSKVVSSMAITMLTMSGLALSLLINFGILTKVQWSYPFAALSGLGVLGSLILLCFIRPQASRENYFSTPFLPFTPAITFLVNVMLIFQLDGLTWMRFAAWMLIGFVIYFCYGFWNSNENQRLSPYDETTSLSETFEPDRNSDIYGAVVEETKYGY